MRGRLADDAEIAWRSNDAAAEMMLPQAIDDYACSERVVRAREPFGKSGAAAGRGGTAVRRPRPNRGRLRVEHREDAGLNLGSFAAPIAALQEERRGRHRTDIRDAERAGERPRL